MQKTKTNKTKNPTNLDNNSWGSEVKQISMPLLLLSIRMCQELKDEQLQCVSAPN